MNEALQQSLYDKLSREQDKYRDWLKGQPPEEILHHSYEYTVREDILMSMEELTLSEAETRALLLSPSPMAILYDKFSDLETGYMDTIRDSIEETAKDEAKKLRELPVYPYPADHARENGELDVYRASFRANVSCKDAIEAAIRDNYHDNRLDAAAVGQVAEQFGQERMLYVLAATVRHFDYDGRISRDNKRWANTIPAYQNGDGMDSDRSVQFVVCSHPGLTDLFLTGARREQRLRQPLTADEIKAAGEAARACAAQQPRRDAFHGRGVPRLHGARRNEGHSGTAKAAALFLPCPHDPQRPQGCVCPDRQGRGPQPVPPTSLRPLQAATGFGGAEAARRKEEGFGAVTWRSGNETSSLKSV